MEVVDGELEVGEDLFQGDATVLFERTDAELDCRSFVRSDLLIIDGR